MPNITISLDEELLKSGTGCKDSDKDNLIRKND